MNSPKISFTFNYHSTIFYAFVGILFLVAANVSAQQKWYVNYQDGDNSNNGSTASSPKKTIDHLTSNNLILPGDTVYIMGQYNNPSYDPNFTYGGDSDRNNPHIWHKENTIKLSNLHGTESLNITIKSYDNTTVLKGDGANIFRITNSSFLRIEGLEFYGEVENIPLATAEGLITDGLQFLYLADNTVNEKNPALSEVLYRVALGTSIAEIEATTFPIIGSISRPSYIDTRGLYMSGSNHIDIINNHIHHTPGGGLRVSESSYVNIIENEINDCSRRSYSGTHALVVTKSKQGTGNSNDDTTYSIKILRNRVHHNYNEIFSWVGTKDLITPRIDEGKGISLQRNNLTDWQNGSKRILVENNLCYWNGFSGVHSNDGYNIDFLHNTCYLNSYTNTITYANKEQKGGNIGISAQRGGNITIANNISVIDTDWGGNALASSSTANLVVKNNLIYGYNGTVSEDPDITSIDVNTYIEDPLFIDESNFDFNLSANSPAIGKADTNYSPQIDFSGNARDASPDLGALESITTTSDIPTGRRLREIAEDKFVYGNVFIGGATHGKLFGTKSLEILNREFNYTTPANDFKQTKIHPEPNKWDWALADQWVDSASLNNQLIRMHSPISPQASKWAKDDARTAAELELNMTEYMTELCKHFNSKPEIEWMDVVNETVNRDGTWFGPKTGTDKWENPWPLIGYDQTSDGLNPPSYIRMAFEIANQQAPDIKLIYNQHGDMEDVMWDKVKATVLHLKSLGLRVDGIGWQAHLETDFLDDPDILTKIESLIDWAHANDLEFHVTENDVDVLTGDDFTKQAEVFAEVVKTVLQKGINGVVSWNAWMVKDDDGKGADGLPTLFDADSQAKPAYYAVQQVLEDLNHEAELNVTVEGAGSVSVTNQTYLRNSTQIITATPQDGYEFAGWSGDVSSTNNPLSITMDSDKSLVCRFSLISCQDITVTLTPTQISCFGETDGAINIMVLGDSGAYTANWSSGQSTDNISALSAGNYTVEITDALGCKATDSIEITEPPMLIIDGVITESTTSIGNGAIDLTVTGGTPSYQIQWDNGPITEDINDLPIGVYTVIVEDSRKCLASSSYEISRILGLLDNKRAVLSIYPNPSTSYIHISYSEYNSNASYFIANLNGEVVSQGKIKHKDLVIKTLNWAKGQYVFVLNSDIGLVTKNIIIE